jgi:hypothetical protein
VRHTIERELIPATQVVSCALWEIAPEALDSKGVRGAVEAVQRGRGVSRDRRAIEEDNLPLEFGSADYQIIPAELHAKETVRA